MPHMLAKRKARHAPAPRRKRRKKLGLPLTFQTPAHRGALLELCILQNLVELGRKGLGCAAPSLGRLRNSRRLGVRGGCPGRRIRAGSRSSPVLSHERATKSGAASSRRGVYDTSSTCVGFGGEKVCRRRCVVRAGMRLCVCVTQKGEADAMQIGL